jgi:hypothetical protein
MISKVGRALELKAAFRIILAMTPNIAGQTVAGCDRVSRGAEGHGKVAWPRHHPVQHLRRIPTMHGRSLAAICFAVLVGFLTMTVPPQQAQADTLSSLVTNHGSLQVGNLSFDQFTYTATGQMPSAANVMVSPFFNASGNPGIRLTGGFTDAYDSSGAQQASDATLTYRVTSLASPLSGIQLSGNPQITGPGDGLMSVVETIQPPGQTPIQLEIHDSVNNSVANLKLQDSAVLPPLPSLQVVSKDILALNLGGFPTASEIDQTFSVNIPEPTSVLVLGVAFLAAAGFRWRHRPA